MSVTFNPFTGNLDFNDTTKASGSDTQIQFNDGGKLSGDSGLVFNKTTDALTIAGPVIHPLGAAATPSLTFTGDPNTGIYSPGADQVAISTNGTGRLFVGSTGNVGVGVSSPNFGLDLQRAAATLNIQSTTGTNSAYTVFQNSGGAFYVGSDNSAGTDFGSPYAGAISQSAAYPILFKTNNIERMRLDSSGRLGLGSSSPDALLTVNGIGAFGAGAVTTPSIAATGDLNTGFWFPAADTLAASTGGSERIRVDGSGNVNVDSGTFYVDAVNNRVSIGTTSPAYPLTVAGTIYISARGSGNSLLFPDWLIYNSSTGNALVFDNGSERARIDSSGRVLIGTSTSVSSADGFTPSVQVAGSGGLAAISIARYADNAFQPQLQLQKSRGGIGAQSLVSASDTLGQLTFEGSDGTAFKSGASIKCEVDGTPGTNDMPGRLVFSTTADGASSPTTRMTIESTGAIKLENGGSNLYRPGASGSGLGFSTNCTIPLNETGTASDNTENLGAAGTRWATVFAGTGTINTSDANLKQDVDDLDAAELSVATAIKGLVKKYRFKDAVEAKGDDARIHVGVIAQEVEQAFVGAGLDPRRYALFCEDELEDGTKRLGIRYDELLAFVIAAL